VSAGPRLDAGETWLRIAVEDTGCGIPVEHLPELFSAFHQVDSSTQRERGGSGLGLALCQRLAQQMGGRIHATSQPGVGSCFTLELPLRERRDPSRTSPVSSAKGPAASQVRDMRLLLAEDSVHNQRLIARVLQQAGARLDVVANGQLAVDQALGALREGRPYDVVLMDVDMPVLDGLTATRTLRDAGYTSPILALTAHRLSDERERCLAEGCDDVATKPIDWPSLFEQLATLGAYRSAKPPAP